MQLVLRLALLVSAVGVLLIAAMVPTATETLPRRIVAAPRDGSRIWFPAGQRSMLTLPDGQSRPVRSLLHVRRPLQFGEYVWNDARVPAGETWVRIDLARQTLSVFRGGQEIGAAVILYGTDGKPTPSGTFPILEKAEHHRSNLYDAEMPFMLRLTNDGVAIHASKVRQGSATHGCIGVPLGFARLLFAQMKRGDAVAILPAATAPDEKPQRTS